MVESSPGTWRDYIWLCAAVAGFDLIMLFFFYPESSFTRPPLPSQESSVHNNAENANSKENIDGMGQRIKTGSESIHSAEAPYTPITVSWKEIWTSFIRYNPNVSLWRAFVIPFVFLASGQVLWLIFLYGCALASQVTLM